MLVLGNSAIHATYVLHVWMAGDSSSQRVYVYLQGPRFSRARDVVGIS
jgi:hypothetical protein